MEEEYGNTGSDSKSVEKFVYKETNVQKLTMGMIEHIWEQTVELYVIWVVLYSMCIISP